MKHQSSYDRIVLYSTSYIEICHDCMVFLYLYAVVGVIYSIYSVYVSDHLYAVVGVILLFCICFRPPVCSSWCYLRTLTFGYCHNNHLRHQVRTVNMVSHDT